MTKALQNFWDQAFLAAISGATSEVRLSPDLIIHRALLVAQQAILARDENGSPTDPPTTEGPPGPQGPPGPAGPMAPFIEIASYIGDTASVAMTDPGSGKLRWNGGTAASTTMLAIDRLDAQADDVTYMWQTVNPTKLVIQEAPDASNTQEYAIGPMQLQGDFFTVTAALVAVRGLNGGGPFAQGTRILLFLSR